MKELDNLNILSNQCDSILKTLEKVNEDRNYEFTKEDFDWFMNDIYSEVLLLRTMIKNIKTI